MNILPLHTQGFENLVTLIFFQGHTRSLTGYAKHDDLPESVDGLCNMHDYRKSG